ncbi:MAG: hypothetical protein A2589_03445 [Candidatus Vogelbacteria bacterium RIFOXYD1_FULL_46_19]|uniref:Right handed beta helix domain-containing protein n=1 Tax=Candidatus Vogelbacteria bacterium RIFOXYD1_FULL_46_19 TaxID=1802439 RepID=A0A1G2QFS4_9BACT|nr:MAG: hypothetical protein A2589_03445 [Candidatus Vogelbacteria bacterium RIFOXYD1_FULL_46_19]
MKIWGVMVLGIVVAVSAGAVPTASPYVDDELTAPAGLAVGPVEKSGGAKVGATLNVPGDFPTVQQAVDAAAAGDTVVVFGPQSGPVLVDKNITLVGGDATAAIVATASMPLEAVLGTNTYHPTLYIQSATVAVADILIDGAGQGNTNYRFIGLLVISSNVTISNVAIVGVRNTPFDGSQHGVGLMAAVGSDLQITNLDISDFQKNAFAAFPDTTVTWNGGSVVGAGPTGITAQNGIQFGTSAGASGTVRNVTVRDIWYTGATWTASALLTQYSNVTFENMMVENCQAGLYAYAPTGLVVSESSFIGNDFNLVYGGSGTFTDNTFADGAGDYGIGLWLYDVVSADGTGNTFENNPYGLISGGTSTNVAFPGSRFLGNGVIGENDTGNVVDVTNSWWGTSDGPVDLPVDFNAGGWQTTDPLAPSVPATNLPGQLFLIGLLALIFTHRLLRPKSVEVGYQLER